MNGQDLSNASHAVALEAFRTAEEPIMVEVLRRKLAGGQPHHQTKPPSPAGKPSSPAGKPPSPPVRAPQSPVRALQSPVRVFQSPARTPPIPSLRTPPSPPARSLPPPPASEMKNLDPVPATVSTATQTDDLLELERFYRPPTPPPCLYDLHSRNG